MPSIFKVVNFVNTNPSDNKPQSPLQRSTVISLQNINFVRWAMPCVWTDDATVDIYKYIRVTVDPVSTVDAMEIFV